VLPPRALLLLPTILFSAASFGQSAPPPVTLATLISQAHSAFSEKKPVNSVQMTGNAKWYGGGDPMEGTATLSASIDGSSSMTLDLQGANRTETTSTLQEGRVCTWSGADGKQHTAASSNCYTAVPWFLPQIETQVTGIPAVLGADYKGKQGAGANAQYMLRHQAIIGSPQTAMDVTTVLQDWSTTDLALDTATFLPCSLSFAVHPDNDSSVSLNEKILYSDYRTAAHVTLPYHIERYVNGTLQLDITIQQASAR
jgi:hypothetical protein